MSKSVNTQNPASPALVMETSAKPDSFEVSEALGGVETTYAITGDDTLSRLAVIQAIHDDIAATISGNSDTLAEAEALKGLVNRKKDAAVLAVAELLNGTPYRVVQATLHRTYGGKVDTQGKVSKTIPAGDGEAFLKAAKAFREVATYVATGAVPDSWSRGSGNRAAIAELLDDGDKAELWNEVTGNAKIRVSDTVTRFFRDLTPNAAPLWMNPDKLKALSEDILVNAEYVRDNAELRIAYETVIAAFDAATKSD